MVSKIRLGIDRRNLKAFDNAFAGDYFHLAINLLLRVHAI